MTDRVPGSSRARCSIRGPHDVIRGVNRTLPARIAAGLAALVAMAATAAVPTAPVRAADLGGATLSSPTQAIRWSGTFADATGQGYNPPTEQTCTPSTCDTFVVDVEVPAGTFTRGQLNPAPPGTTTVHSEGPSTLPGDGVLISVKWATDFDQWNLFVDDMSTGLNVAKGIDLDSNAQSILLSMPHNGRYKVTVAPFYTAFAPGDTHYDAEARVQLDALQRQPAGTPLLPVIRTAAPTDFHLGDIPPILSNPTGWRFTPNGTFANSCYLDETQQNGSTRCLRFDNNIENIGMGPLTLRFSYSPDAFVNNCAMAQEIIHSDAAVLDRNAGPCVFHQQHGHFHYQNMGRYQLFGVAADGTPTPAPVAESKKVGFCTIDVDDITFGQASPLRHPRTYSFPTCNIPNAASPVGGPFGPGATEYMGISPGWGDVYTWDLPAQYIDITDTTRVPDGLYLVVSRSNPDGGILTADRSLETGVTCIRIAGSTVTEVRQFPSQSNTAPLPTCATRSASVGTGTNAANPGGAAVPGTTGASAGNPNTSAVRAPTVTVLAAAAALALITGRGRRRRRRAGVADPSVAE